MSEVNFENLHGEIKRKKLLNDATLITVDCGSDANRNNQVNLLCKAMVNAAKIGPVKAEYEDRMFAVDKGATMEQTLQAWKEQAWKPYISENFKPETLARVLNLSENTDLGNTARSYKDAASVEVLVTKYPEYADRISMLQLLNAFEKSSRKNIDAVGKALIQSAKRFTNGEETFPINLENMVALNEHKDKLVFALSVGVNSKKLDERIQESELKMLKSLEPDDLTYVSDAVISVGARIAERHEKDLNGGVKMFTQEMMNRFLKDNQNSQTK